MLKDIDECKIDFKIAQESIRKKILPYHLFAMNSTVIHDIPSLFFISESEFLSHFQGFQTPKREFSFYKIENAKGILTSRKRILFLGFGTPGNGIKTHFPI